jgi:hypothetical protein
MGPVRAGPGPACPQPVRSVIHSAADGFPQPVRCATTTMLPMHLVTESLRSRL